MKINITIAIYEMDRVQLRRGAGKMVKHVDKCIEMNAFTES